MINYIHSFTNLEEPLNDRQVQLEESLKLQQFFRDAEDEMHWIKEHKPLATSDDVGKSFQEAQNLIKKHQVSYYWKLYTPVVN